MAYISETDHIKLKEAVKYGATVLKNILCTIYHNPAAKSDNGTASMKKWLTGSNNLNFSKRKLKELKLTTPVLNEILCDKVPDQIDFDVSSCIILITKVNEHIYRKYFNENFTKDLQKLEDVNKKVQKSPESLLPVKEKFKELGDLYVNLLKVTEKKLKNNSYTHSIPYIEGELENILTANYKS